MPAAAKAGVDFELFVDEELAQQGAASPLPKHPVRLQLDGAAGKQRDQVAIPCCLLSLAVSLPFPSPPLSCLAWPSLTLPCLALP